MLLQGASVGISSWLFLIRSWGKKRKRERRQRKTDVSNRMASRTKQKRNRTYYCSSHKNSNNHQSGHYQIPQCSVSISAYRSDRLILMILIYTMTSAYFNKKIIGSLQPRIPPIITQDTNIATRSQSSYCINRLTSHHTEISKYEPLTSPTNRWPLITQTHQFLQMTSTYLITHHCGDQSSVTTPCYQLILSPDLNIPRNHL